MKKYLLLVALVLSTIPATLFAQSSDNVDIDPQGTSNCLVIVNNLRYRSTDFYTNNEVSALQDFLQNAGYLQSNPTGFFGLMTFASTKKFQSDNNISPTGYVGPITRAKIQAITCNSTTTATPPNTQAQNNQTQNSTPSQNYIPTTQTTSVPVVLYPNGGEVLNWGQQTWISWTPDSYTGYYDVSVRGIGSGNVYTISQYVPSKATDKLSVSWTPTQGNYEKDTQFVAKVCKSGTQVCDESNSSFSIPNSYAKPIILYPNNGEVLQGDIAQYISWTPQNNSGSFDISIIGIYSGNSYSVAQNVPYVASDKISTSWIPTTGSYEKDTLFKARVCITGTTICGESNNFSIKF